MEEQRGPDGEPVGAGGNTETPAPPQKKGGLKETQLYRFCFTLKAEGIHWSQVSQELKDICKKYSFQLEKSKTGYEHYQGVFSLNQKERMQTLKNKLGWNTIHLEPCKNWIAATKYCTKDHTRIGGPWTENSVTIKTIEVLYPWQESIKEQCLGDINPRQITWIYDEIGNSGKSEFCIYMAIHHNAVRLTNGAMKDLSYALPDNPRIVLFDFTRSTKSRINYQAIEEIKGGYVFSSKYESKQKIFNKPHVIIFANFLPNVTQLSIDRWDIRKMENMNLTKIDAKSLINSGNILEYFKFH